MRIARALGGILVVLGLTIVLFAGYEVYGTARIARGHQAVLRVEFARELRSAPSSVRTPGPAPVPKLGRALARIRIPAIDVDDVVVEGTSPAQLRFGPGHYPDTALPGHAGSSAIAGHRTGWGSPFVNLDRLRAGDAILVQTTESTFTYRVTRTTIVDPGATWVLRGDPASAAARKLTLTTCTPKYTSRRRLIVWADLAAPAGGSAR